MTWEEFMKGITLLYAFGLQQKDDWQLRLWYIALEDEMDSASFEEACVHLCKNNIKFWENDNIAAQILEAHQKIKDVIAIKLVAQKCQDNEARRQRIHQEAIDSYDSEEDRLKCVEEFKEMNMKMLKPNDSDLDSDIDK